MGFFDFILNLFADTPEKALQREIKKRLKLLSAMSPQVLIPRSEQISPVFATYLFDIFRPLIPVLKMMQEDFKVKKGMPFKRYLVSNNLNSKQQTILEDLDEQNIIRQIADTPKKEFYRVVENQLKGYYAEFKPGIKAEINASYNDTAIFARLAGIDLVKVFKEFDRGFNENDHSYTPNFHGREMKYFRDDLEVMNRVFTSLEFNKQLASRVIEFCKFRNLPLTDEKALIPLFKKVEVIKDKRILEAMLEIMKKDMEYVPGPFLSDENIVRDDINKIVQEKKQVIDESYDKIKYNHVVKLTNSLFGNDLGPPLKNYTAAANENFTSFDLMNYMFIDEVAILKSFMIVKYNLGIKELLNTVIVKGRFNDKEIQKSLSDNYYKLNDALDTIVKFDESVGEYGDYGSRLKKLFLSIGKDKKTPLIINDIIENVNNEAKKLIQENILMLKSLMQNFSLLAGSIEEGSKKILVNFADFDGNNTKHHVERMKSTRSEIVNLLNIIKMIGR